MAPLSLKIILNDGAITRTIKFDTTTKVREADHIVRDKILTLDPNKEYGFFLASADNDCSGVWLDDGAKTLEYYMLRDGDSLHYLLKIRNMRLRMLDGAVKTLQLDETKKVSELMVHICNKLRISHSEEYGLCREETETAEDSKHTTGTLTLQKKTIQREKDAKLEQLSKKLKTDDLVEWLDQHKTLRELKVDPQEMLLFKRRLFFSDRNVDSRDPVQLNLLYVQTRDGILEGKQVVTETKALEFAGLQCQIQFGDYQEEKHKPGFIQNLKEFLPEQYVSWGVEKKTIKEHKKHVGVPEIEAKHQYTKMARELPTYGVTFFLVKEKQLRKKKLVPRLLGINAQSILRLDEETKEIIQVWLLTQVKSYRADYESFALNFGDYSEKEYVVKTNEGFRIKDILEGYIDIIKKSLAAPRKVNFTEAEAMYEDNVERSRGTTIQNYTASKIIESSLVGPSQIISVEQGQQVREGTQILTINELVKTNLSNDRQHPLISQRAQLQFNKRQVPSGFENTMKNYNSKCVTTVVYLSDPTQENIEKAKHNVVYLEDSLPAIIAGIKETATASSPLKSKVLLNNLDDLCSYVNQLSYETKNSDLNNEENLIKVQNAAKKAADLSTKMHLSLDPNTKRRSKILMQSRDSFIQDEKTEASLRRASFLAATDNTWTVVESSAHLLDEAPETVLSHDECKQLEKTVAYEIGKLQASVAMILNSHADPANIDYEGAVKSMQTLSEIIPIFIQDIRQVITAGDEETGQELKKYVRQLLDCTRAMCMLTGSDNVNKMYDVGNDYADVCKKITEHLTKYNDQTPDVSCSLNNEIVKLVQNVGSKVQLLLMGTSELTKLEASDPRAMELDAAAIKCTDATECLIACARLTLSSIHEPHSKSAITAATENISSSAQNMAILWKSLSEKPNRKTFAKQLANSTFELAKTLDKLRNKFSNIKVINEETKSNKRLQFIATARSADKIITEANVELQQMSNLPVILVPKNEAWDEHPELKNNLSQKLAHLNAAIAALLQAMGDSNPSNYGKAETAIDIISKLIPDIIKDSKYLNGQVDEATWTNISKYLKDILEATKDICANANESNEESLNSAASQFANASGRLTYIYNPRKKCDKENQIMDFSKSAVDEISQMLTRVNDLVKTVSRDDGDLLDNAGVKVVAPAQRLLKIAEITAPNINEARCQESLLSAIDDVSHEIESLKNTWTPMLKSSEHKPKEDQLNNNWEVVNKILNALREACTDSDGSDNPKKQEFTTSMSAAENALEEANRQLEGITDSRLQSEVGGRNRHPVSRNNLSQKLALLNAAVAALLQATGDPDDSDYVKAKSAVDIISELTPDIIKDSKNLNGQVDETTWKNITEYLKDMLEATRDICANADESNTEILNKAASQFANASGRLTYIYNPRKKCNKENQIMDFSKSAVDEISQMLTRVNDLVKTVSRDDGDLLDNAGVKVVAPAQRLLKIAEITAPNINEARCQESLLSAIDDVSHEIENLKNTWTPMLKSSEHKPEEDQLNNNWEVVNKTLNALREACTDSDGADNPKKQEFTTSMSAAENALEEANRQLEGITDSRLQSEVGGRNRHPVSRNNLSQKLALLNAAVAALLQATGDPDDSDYVKAKSAVDIISELTPDIIKDSKNLNGQVDETTWKNITEYLKDMLEATRDICANADESNTEILNEAASQFANASGKLTYIYNPRKKCNKENQILDFSKSAVDKISQMLTRVNDLVKTVSRDDGDLLDNAGVKVVAPAQRLLKIAEITAPNINEARCQESLLSAIDDVSHEIENLKNTWTPMLKSSEHKPEEDQLNNNWEVVNKTLNALREACTDSDGADNPKKQEFTTSMSAAENALEEASRQLEGITDSRLQSEVGGRNGHPVSRNNLSQKLALLNAAVAALLQATGDPDDSDYVKAKSAVDIISELTPDIIKDSKNLNGHVDETTWKNITEYLKDMLEATRDICANADESNTEILNKATSQFANASGRLTYIYNPRKKCNKENQIMDVSKSAVDEISQMLTRVNDLVKTVSRDDGDLLDNAGVKVVAPAQRLLKIAEITAPNINEARCQESLLSAIDDVSHEIENLKNTWTPILQSLEHKLAEDQLNNNWEVVNKTLNDLRGACRNSDDAENLKKQEFTTSMSATESALEEASRQLEGITDSRTFKEEVEKENDELRISLFQKLSHLNAAVAALLQATEDSNNADYGKAKSAVDIIRKLAPDIIKESKHLNGQVDETTWNSIGEHLHDMLEATREICAITNESNEQDIGRAASKFANSSKKLRFIFNPIHNSREDKMLCFAKTIEDEVSRMLPEMTKLANGVGGAHQGQLQNIGKALESSVHQLHRTAELTAPSIQNSESQDLLVLAINDVSTKQKHFMDAWKPFLEDDKYIQIEKELQDSMKIVDTNKLEIAKAINEKLPEAEALGYKQPDQLQITIDSAKKAVYILNEDLKDMSAKHPTTRVDDVSLTKKLLAQKLGQLNAALASIQIANTDPNTGCKISSVNIFSKLLSDIFKDAKQLHGTTDAQTWNATLENLKTINNASEVMYDNIQENPENVDVAVAKLASSVAILNSIYNEGTNSSKENQIQHLSRCAVEQISLLLPHVYSLAKTIPGNEGTELDQVGVKVVDGAKQFLKTAQITASTIDNLDCQEVLLSSVDHLKKLGHDLKNAWESIVQTPKNREINSQLDHNLNMVNSTLEKIRNTCLGDNDQLKIEEKLQNLNIWKAKEKIKEAEKLFYEEQNAPNLKTEGVTDKSVFEKRMQLTQKIAQINEAVALLLQAMLDRRNPDYKTVKESIDVMSNLTPDVIKETMDLQANLDDDSRQIIFEEIKCVCNAIQEVCSSVENNSLEELLQGATKYAQASGKLLHLSSPHGCPNKERKILELSRNACERTSLLLSRLSRLAGITDGADNRGAEARGEGAHELEAVGITVADAAHALLTNAQITAPSINDENCQAVLLSSAEKLSDLAQSLKNYCHPITTNAEAQDIETQLRRDLTLLNKDIADLKKACQSSTEDESINLHHQTNIPLSEKIKLESQSKIETDNLLQSISDTVRQEDNEDTLLVEDTPLRQLALKILESVKSKVKSNSLPQKEQKELEKFSQDLSVAVNTLDLTNARCINKPLDSRRRQDMELAIMDLQQICLLSKRGQAHSNVVDLTDYIDDVISMVHNFTKTADGVNLQPTDQGNEAFEELRNKCQKIQENYNELQNPETLDTEGGSIIDNMLRIDQFAKDCDDRVHEINSLILKIDSESVRNVLQDKLQHLKESCDLLRFAAKSSISSAASVEFDETIQNLESVEKNIENILQTNEELNKLQEDNKMSFNPLKHTIQSAQTKLIAAILSEHESNLPKELIRYAVTMQSEITTLDYQMKLKDHLCRLLNFLKLQTSAKSRRVATWQEVDVKDDIITSNIFEELETFSRYFDSQKAGIKGPTENIILDSDVRSMLLSNKSVVEGEEEELKSKLSKQIQKTSTVVQSIMLSFHKPEMLSRSLRMTLNAVEELTALSKGLKGKNLLQNKRIEEATQEVKLATYNLIKTSETLSQLPVPDSRRKLLEACRSLNEALNKIGRTICPGTHEYCEMQRDLQLATQLEPQCAPASAPLSHYAEQMQSQLELINILRSSEGMTDNSRSQLRHITSSVCNGTELGAQCAYLLSLSDEDKDITQHGDIDRYRISKSTGDIQDTCLQIICSGNGEQAKELECILVKQINQLEESLDDNTSKIKNDQKEELLKQSKNIHIQFKELQEALNSTTFREKEVTPRTFKLMDAIKKLNIQLERVPRPKIDDSPKKKETTKEVTGNMKKLINSTSTMIKKASCCEENSVTWENIGGNDVIQAFEALISCIRKRGTEAGLIESEEPEIPAKSYVQTQIALANTWLTKPASKEDTVIGVKAAESILELAEKMCEVVGDGEKEEFNHVIIETKQLLNDCITKYNSEKASELRERLHDARKLCERGAVTRVVESFLHEPHQEIETLVHEPDMKKRKFLLDKKIAELLAHLARVAETARFVADTGVAPRQALIDNTDQVELLAPVLVKAAEKRINNLDDQVAIENYQKLLANYAESLTKIRDLCDRSVDPIDFSRAAGETIHHIKEESSRDPRNSAHTSDVIIKLGQRVVEAGLQAPLARKDAELRRTLRDIQAALARPHAGDLAAEILKKTGEVESALGGENIFQKEPVSNQPIYEAALQLHASLRGWSARHNDVVHGAKLLAVLMARLSHYMDTDNKRELIITSKAIVDKSREIADIARKLAIECTDMRIRTNLLQVCERIPTISGQLKMLTTVKSSSLGQGQTLITAEDKEAMNMVVGNAQNLMTSIQEVVKAAESASVKIMSSQRGYRMKWIQRNYY